MEKKKIYHVCNVVNGAIKRWAVESWQKDLKELSMFLFLSSIPVVAELYESISPVMIQLHLLSKWPVWLDVLRKRKVLLGARPPVLWSM